VLKTRQQIPALAARTPAGQTIRSGDFRQKKNLVIAFLHAGCPGCASWLKKLSVRAPELAEQEAVALIVFSEMTPAVTDLALPRPCIVAADLSGRAQRAYLGHDAFGPAGQQRLGVFVADRYGELFAHWVGADEDALPGTEEVVSWLSQIEVACEECGVSHWPADN
jgi:peroxiredoxin